ncbi:acyltransferase [Mycolicibacterium murale]|uniref:Acyltransferase n=1 Tax=Mycolicibacterium murale TaxID=182220 RepID=A0A7I9WQY2_9MYCO|nr:condensation domain-containing protein [Mycolicibacterium murale]ANW64642.1 acyltransferase [Mycobacterium sp. djl-10]MCV7183255.1 acyltransferase [Mycolicibacterium murale]GFG59983.1 acyltransferase [Mycolicibacterium murale]
MVAIKAIHDWMGEPGTVVSWHPSPATLKKVQQAPVSDVPVSYQQAQHIRGYRSHVAAGTDMARLNIPAWDIPGQCDLRAMTHVINSYVRRHDTYHSWFELPEGSDEVIRHTVANPKDIKLVPTDHGEMTPAQWREHVLATPDPLTWDCFHFGIIQRDDHFTFYISVDHVHTDAMFMGLVLVEIHMMYLALVDGAAPLQLPPAGSYADFCHRQAAYTAALTLDTPEVRGWVEFFQRNDGTMPVFPLPLGDFSLTNTGDVMTVQLLDAQQSHAFEAACMDAGARYSGGVIACAAIAEAELTGTDTYHIITPTTTRNGQSEFMTTGWFTGLVPMSVPVGSFAETARAGQQAFDAGMPLKDVPHDRVFELAEGTDLGLRTPGPGVPMLSYLDAGLPPLSPAVIAQWEAMNGKVFSDARAAYQVGMYVNRSAAETALTVTFPNNPVARESVLRYVAAMKAVYVRVAEGREVSNPSGRPELTRVVGG